jgi:hypothetical protein
VTRYAVDRDRGELVATWATGLGDVAERVAAVPAQVEEAAVLTLADTLTELCEQLWRTYTHPASSADDLEPDGEGWHREEHRKAFAEVVRSVREPNLPEDGYLLREYNPVTESAHRVGRALHAIDDEALTEVVAGEASAEMEAVEQAERGELVGRSRQALVLSRADASPLQVAAADAMLRVQPFGDDRMFTEIEPSAAAIAAAHWLAAAAEVTGETSGVEFAHVVMEADHIEALPHESPTLVLHGIAEGETPRDLVLTLIADAQQAADGEIPDLLGLLAEVAHVTDTAEQQEVSEEDLPDLLPHRTTPLDPTRPARDLLEDLLLGIHGCWLVYQEYYEEEDEEGEPATEPAAATEEETEVDEEFVERARAAFIDEVRAAALAHADRLI